jgi:hypothetical protein
MTSSRVISLSAATLAIYGILRPSVPSLLLRA